VPSRCPKWSNNCPGYKTQVAGCGLRTLDIRAHLACIQTVATALLGLAVLQCGASDKQAIIAKHNEKGSASCEEIACIDGAHVEVVKPDAFVGCWHARLGSEEARGREQEALVWEKRLQRVRGIELLEELGRRLVLTIPLRSNLLFMRFQRPWLTRLT
jgi:hypothetical protein